MKWTCYYLHSIIDIYSRYTVGWMVATKESMELAERLLGDTVAKQDIDRDQLTIHADRGSSMASKPVAFLLADLGVTKSHSRPHCSNDNPFSEAQFKILKYRPDFPERFGSVEARAFCASSIAGTTTSTGTLGSGCTPLPMSTTATPQRSAVPRPAPCPRKTAFLGADEWPGHGTSDRCHLLAQQTHPMMWRRGSESGIQSFVVGAVAPRLPERAAAARSSLCAR